MKRHTYRPPRATGTRIFAFLAGVTATVGVFVAIPLSQRLNDIFQEESAFIPEEIAAEPPESQDFEVDEPPPEQEPEEQPEEMLEQPANLDLGLEVADLPGGSGGGFVLDIPKFALKDAAEEMMGGDLDAPPQPTGKFPPAYPPALLRSGIGGRVLVACVVDAEGNIVSSIIRSSSGHAELDKAALAAVGRWKFKPGTKAGQKVKATCVVPFTFEVKK